MEELLFKVDRDTRGGAPQPPPPAVKGLGVTAANAISQIGEIRLIVDGQEIYKQSNQNGEATQMYMQEILKRASRDPIRGVNLMTHLPGLVADDLGGDGSGVFVAPRTNDAAMSIDVSIDLDVLIPRFFECLDPSWLGTDSYIELTCVNSPGHYPSPGHFPHPADVNWGERLY